ncbi:MAG: hypothetical protein FH748_13815 [Balneolaceae bacterium]|nr:hypothetical protein [Balneolaceae bacterium]
MKKLEYSKLEEIQGGDGLDVVNGACAGVAAVGLLIFAGVITVATGGIGGAIAAGALAGSGGFCFGAGVAQGLT